MKQQQDKYDILKTYYGYDTFRDGQEELIDCLLNGQDVCGIMPTGAGKSVCYQVPALLLPHVTLVVSPLISLMKDQVRALNQMGVHAAYLNSSLSWNQYKKALAYAKEGRYKIIYVAPERLLTEDFLDFAASTPISLLAVDEAHCVSQWGQDFRPSYLKIPEFVRTLPIRPVIGAFTATATREVREDIIRMLELSDPHVAVTGFDRKNLYFEVRHDKDKYRSIRDYLLAHPDSSGVIYCATRKNVEEVCDRLLADGFRATRYHAGLSDEERRANQEAFTYDDAPIMVATNAFGMGIDKSNVRFVLHYNMPKNMESYYQEAGRAGRDGLPSECVLFYSGQDVVTNQFFIDRMEAAEGMDEETAALVQERERERLKKMTFYCFTNECLRAYILRYFGEYGDNYCGNCSNCLTQFEEKDVSETAKNLIGCVKTARRSYGMTLIVDTVHGSKNSRLIQVGMDQNPYYGTCEEEPIYRLRQILNHLLVEGYLFLTDDKYPVLELTEKSEEILNGGTLLMKTAKEQPKKIKEKKPKKRLLAEEGEVDYDLFEKLRGLRMELAKKDRVPPYLVFTDKTLTQMCQLHPKTKEEMLMVSGVGENKFRKYGEAFLALLNEERQD